MFAVGVNVSPGRYRVPVPPTTVFQPTKMKPVFTRFPELPGRVTDANSSTVFIAGAVPDVGVFPLYVTVNFHIA